ncbi:MAG: hypothetical protein IKK34_03120 [Clostridia bacterium]|nr:hypothetical protein [Clostridia bacterium]
MRFLFYDVETANQKHIGSICAIGWCLVQGMDIVYQGYTLVDPQTPFNAYNTSLHGISASDVVGVPTFADYWHRSLGDLIRNCIIVAHGADFDIRSTEQALFDNGIGNVEINYFDFLPVAKAMIPECSNHRLDTLASWAGISFDHHHASDDARALFQIAKTLCERRGFGSLEEMFIRSRCVLQSSLSNSYEPHSEYAAKPEREYKPFPEHRRAGSVERIDNVLEGCSFCITGNVGSYERSEVEEMILSHGGQFKMSVSKKLNFLVVGPYGDNYTLDYMSGKHKDAMELVNQGYPIHIISDWEFLEMMNDPGSNDLVVSIREAEQNKKRAEQEKERIRQEKIAARAAKEAEKGSITSKKKASLGVIQLSLSGEFIAQYESASSAANATGINVKCIRDAAKGIQKTAGGFAWEFCKKDA